MKIVFGICGFGNGHSARSAHVLRALLARGHEVALIGFDNSAAYFRQHFPTVPLFEVHVPIIHVSARSGIDFGRSAAEPYNVYSDGNALNFGAMQGLWDALGGKPDLVLSDYEWIAAQYAYALSVPLVTLDQQSKFAGYHFPEVNGFSRLEEKSRLSLFFPVVAARFACSFFQVAWEADPSFPVTLIPPILREEFFQLSPQPTAPDGQVVVYFSPHGSLQQSTKEIYALLRQFPERRFLIFSREGGEDQTNLTFKPFAVGDFLAALQSAAAVITTAGHNLLSELAFLQKPVYTLPFPTFDQQCCAYMINQLQIGVGAETLTIASLGHFFDHLPHYQDHLARQIGLTASYNGLDVFLQHLEARFGV